jgi:uncharacterized protein (DUF305 family)
VLGAGGCLEGWGTGRDRCCEARRQASCVGRDVGDRENSGSADVVVSDAMLERLFRWLLIGLAAAVLAAGIAGVALWVASVNDPPPAKMNAVDVGFLQDMIVHHEQALLIANIYLDERPDSGVAPYAREVLLYQEREIEWMNDWLAEEGYDAGEPDRMAMGWMGMAMPMDQMPGMQTQERLDELDAATGEDADRLFFQIMADHHLGGIHMGDFAKANGAREEIIDFAGNVSRNRSIEIVECQAAYERLGLWLATRWHTISIAADPSWSATDAGIRRSVDARGGACNGSVDFACLDLVVLQLAVEDCCGPESERTPQSPPTKITTGPSEASPAVRLRSFAASLLLT